MVEKIFTISWFASPYRDDSYHIVSVEAMCNTIGHQIFVFILTTYMLEFEANYESVK